MLLGSSRIGVNPRSQGQSQPPRSQVLMIIHLSTYQMCFGERKKNLHTKYLTPYIEFSLVQYISFHLTFDFVARKFQQGKNFEV